MPKTILVRPVSKEGCKAMPSTQDSDIDCGYHTTISCDDCIYGGAVNHTDRRRGRNPAAARNQVPKSGF